VREYIAKISDGVDLTASEAERAMEMIMDGNATAAQIGALLMGLKLKGESSQEITGFARAMRRRALGFKVPMDVVDTCGTGGIMQKLLIYPLLLLLWQLVQEFQ